MAKRRSRSKSDNFGPKQPAPKLDNQNAKVDRETGWLFCPRCATVLFAVNPHYVCPQCHYRFRPSCHE